MHSRKPENPYESPAGDEEEPSPEIVSDDYPRWRFFATHLLYNGCNLLGGLHVFAALVGLVVCLHIAAEVGPHYIGRMIFVLLFLLAAADVTIRLWLNPNGVIQPLFVSWAGGSIAFIPVWTIYAVIVLDQSVKFLRR